DGRHLEPMASPQFLEGPDVAGSIAAETEVGAHRHHPHVRLGDQNRRDELLGVHRPDVPQVEDAHPLHPEIAQQLDAAVDAGEQRRRLLGFQDFDGVRVESENTGNDVFVAASRHQALVVRDVSPVDTFTAYYALTGRLRITPRKTEDVHT